MPELTAFALSVLLLLATPGPTNTLLATSGAMAGRRASFRLILAELAGYGVAITTLIVASRPVVTAFPLARSVIALALAGYLCWLALRLWRIRSLDDLVAGGIVTFRMVFVTTLLNPKALVFAFAIFPPMSGPRDALPYAALFAVLTPAVAICWIVFGAIFYGLAARQRVIGLPQVSALVLLFFAGVIAASALATL